MYIKVIVYIYQTITGKIMSKNSGNNAGFDANPSTPHRLPDFESQDMDLDERKDSNPNPRANVAGSAGGNCKIATVFFVAVFSSSFL